MKIIDLLNKIAKGEEVPKKIRIREVDYNFTKFNTKNLTFSDRGSNINYAYENDFENYWLDCARINEEIEIIEEEKEIKEMIINEQCLFSNMKECTYLSPEERRLLDSNFKELGNKINKLVRELNKIKKEGK